MPTSPVRFGMMGLCLAASILGTRLTASALHADGPRVPGFERWHAAAADGAARRDSSLADPVRGGLLLIGELNCLACHPADDQVGIRVKQAPRLDEVGARVRPAYLRELLLNPAEADPGTTMPHLLHAATDDERLRQAESLVHFLASAGSFAESAAIAAGVQQGRRLFHSVGCLACHDAQEADVVALPTSVPLANLSHKYAVPGLARFLQDPLHTRPSGRMPQLNLTQEEARDIACFLLRDLKVPPLMSYHYYEGNWEKLPDFDQLTVKASGTTSSFDPNLGASDHFAIRFRGQFRVAKEGTYRFSIRSDDGSRMLIDGQEVVANDGIHPLTAKEEKVVLKEGEHSFVVEYFESAGGQELSVEFEGPGVPRQSLEFALIPPPGSAVPPRFRADPQLARQGGELFESAGCAACHEMQVSGKRLVSRLSRKRLTELSSGGCLSEQPQPGTPYFGLTALQRTNLGRAIEALSAGQRPLAGEAGRLHHTLAALNCYACHERGGVGGVEPSRNSHFQSNQPEMGDEGRLPPSLTGVGAKLQPKWLRDVLEQGAKERPSMFTRMPKFGKGNVESLAADLEKLDRSSRAAIPLPATTATSDRQLKAVGRHLVGERGLSCVKCHTWGQFKATGIQAISLTTMYRRLDPHWFRQYLLNPQTYRPGTRMPAAWPNGQSPFAGILDGDPSQQIRAVWTYLQDEDRAAVPIGVGQQMIELTADKEPVLYRNFIAGAGARAIGVGYPERVNIAFDANDCRLALVWQGAFIDASLHWIGRASGFQKPLGDHLLQMPEGVAFAALKSLEESWPTQPARDLGVAFRGYRLDTERRPVFLYRWKQTEFEEVIEPAVLGEHRRLKRTIRATAGSAATGWFRAIVASRISDSGDGWFLVDGDWKVRITAAGGRAEVRNSQGKQELLAPVDAVVGGRLPTIEVELVW